MEVEMDPIANLRELGRQQQEGETLIYSGFEPAHVERVKVRIEWSIILQIWSCQDHGIV